MRQLNDQERALTEKNLKRLTEEIKIFQDNLAYSMAFMTKQAEGWEFDDKWRTYLRGQKEKSDQQFIKNMMDNIEEREQTIKICNDQLNNGVEEKSRPRV